jgi:hypothetical protein
VRGIGLGELLVALNDEQVLVIVGRGAQAQIMAADHDFALIDIFLNHDNQ